MDFQILSSEIVNVIKKTTTLRQLFFLKLLEINYLDLHSTTGIDHLTGYIS